MTNLRTQVAVMDQGSWLIKTVMVVADIKSCFQERVEKLILIANCRALRGTSLSSQYLFYVRTVLVSLPSSDRPSKRPSIGHMQEPTLVGNNE